VSDSNGSFPHSSATALLLIDVINDLDFPDADAMLEQALPMARRLAEFKRRVSKNSIPAIYVNDNFGQWRSDFRAVVKHCTDPSSRGAPIAKLLRPQEEDYFVLKAKHSGFYHTQLDLLVNYLQVRTIVLAGFTTDICVLFTASDAYLRDLEIVVPPDCSAADSVEHHEGALEHMERVLHVKAIPSTEIDFTELLQSSHDAEQPAIEVS